MTTAVMLSLTDDGAVTVREIISSVTGVRRRLITSGRAQKELPSWQLFLEPPGEPARLDHDP